MNHAGRISVPSLCSPSALVALARCGEPAFFCGCMVKLDLILCQISGLLKSDIPAFQHSAGLLAKDDSFQNIHLSPSILSLPIPPFVSP